MARDTRPLKIVEDRVQVPQASQGEGDQNEDSSQSLPPPRVPVPDQPPANVERQQTGCKNRNNLDVARFIVELITLAVLSWYTILTRGLWKEASRANTFAQDANRQTREAMLIAERPWIATHLTLSDPITFRDSGQMDVPVSVTLRNIGHSVAIDIWVSTQIVFLSPAARESALDDFNAARTKRDGLCEELRDLPDPGEGFALFPEQQSVIGVETSVLKEDVESKAFMQSPSPGKFVNPVVIGCATYKDIFTPQRHVTGFAYSVYSNIHPNGYLSVGEGHLVEDLVLFPHTFIGPYID